MNDQGIKVMRLRKEPLAKRFVGRWVPVVEALPPQRMAVLVAIFEDDVPGYAWLKYAAGDKNCPFFVCPYFAGIQPRTGRAGTGPLPFGGYIVTHWFAPTPQSLPMYPRSARGNVTMGLASGFCEIPNSTQRRR